MKMFDKIKDLFTEEVEVEKEEPVKKEVIQVEIKAPEISTSKVEEEKEDNDYVEKLPSEITPLPKREEEKHNFPVFFDENDFDDIKKEEVDDYLKDTYNEPFKDNYKDTYKEPYKEPYKEVYSPKQVEKKKFSPTPIISPIYGVLDKNYKKDDIVDKPKKSSYIDNTMTVDDVRNKAYGTLEDELESTLFGKTSIMFASKEAGLDYEDIEEELKDAAEALDLLKEDSIMNKKEEIENNKDENIEDLLDEEFDVKKEDDLLDKDFKSDDKLSESDLFNLIDDMYGKGDN